MRLLLDTAIFIWAVNSSERISQKAMAALQDDKAVREMSAISITEITIKQSIGKLMLRKDDILLGIANLRLRILHLYCKSCSSTLRTAGTPPGSI